MDRIGRFTKYALGILFFAVPASASFFPPVLSSAGVTASTVAAVVINQPTIGAGSNQIGSVNIIQPGSQVLATSGTITGSLPAGTNALGSVTISTGGVTAVLSGAVPAGTNGIGSVTVSTGGVTAAQGGAWTVSVATGGVSVKFDGTQTVNVATGGVTAAQGGTWTVQPGNTANTTPWVVQVATGGVSVKFDGTQTVNVATGGVTAAQGPSGSNGWKIDLTTGARVNTIGGPNLGVDLSTGAQVNGALADNGVAAATNRVGVVPSIYQTSYLNGTAATQGKNGALSQGTDGLLWTAQLPAIRPASYSASTFSITAAAGATNIACLSGNASNTVLLYGLRASCTQTTAGNIVFEITKGTAAFTGSWSTMTTTADDTSINVGVSSAVFFNNTVATLNMDTIQYVDTYSLGCMATGTTTPNDIYISPASWRVKPKVLRGVAQSICVNLERKTVTGGLFNVGFDYIETATISP